MSVFVKDPDEVIDYQHNWSTNYLASGEDISTSVWAVTPTGSLTIDSESETITTATVFVSGGTRGKVYRLTNKITTTASRTAERTITVRVEER